MPDKIRRFATVVAWCVVLAVSISVAAPGLVGGSPHIDEHSHHDEDHGSIYNPQEQGNYTVHLYRSETADPTKNPHAPDEPEVSKWYEIVIPPNGVDNPHADEDAFWVQRASTFTFQASACELEDLRTFSLENADPDNPPSNGTGGPGDRGNYAGWEGEITSVDTNHERDVSGFPGSTAWDNYQTYVSNEGGEEMFPLAWGADGRRDDYFIAQSETLFWSPEQSLNNGSRKPFDLTAADRVVVDWADCFTNPSTPGWYRQGSWSELYWNGTGLTPEEAERVNTANNSTSLSHWVYICECESYDEAVSTLGAPPGFTQDGDPVATRPDWIEGGGGGDDGGDDTPTPTEGGDDTPTPTEGGDDTPTPTEGGDDTPTPTEGGDDTPTPTEGGDDTPTPTDMPEDEDTDTPADSGGQPGFGVIVAALALLGAALLARRRR